MMHEATIIAGIYITAISFVILCGCLSIAIAIRAVETQLKRLADKQDPPHD